jgi:hypothetical protein
MPLDLSLIVAPDPESANEEFQIETLGEDQGQVSTK